MLHDLRGTYIRPEEPVYRGGVRSALTIAALWIFALAAFAVLIWFSIGFGDVPGADPTTYFPYITQGRIAESALPKL